MESAFLGIGGESRLQKKCLTVCIQISPFECQTGQGQIAPVLIMLFVQIKIKLSKQTKASFITDESMALSFPNTHRHDTSGRLEFLPFT